MEITEIVVSGGSPDAVLLSHNHYGHLDIRTLRALEAGHAPLGITPLGNDASICRHVSESRIRTATGGRHSCRSDLRGSLVPANHWSSRGSGDRRMALWGGFMIRAGSWRPSM
ncbi:hypothetical protein HHL26_00565 [Sphingobium sp. TB-6]|nr:hypothetical protein [Sphingobium sp. TB-6]